MLNKIEKCGRILTAYGRNESGATAIEYGLIAAIIGAVLIGALTEWSAANTRSFNKLSTAINSTN